jgi:hypothetical protein
MMSSDIGVAVMQPYFFPYAGYYRLFACCDRFVILDCVQFPRRGRVHRCDVPGPSGAPEWLTLPLAQQPREVLIRNLAFAPDAPAELSRRLARHRWFAMAEANDADALRAVLRPTGASVADYLAKQLRLTARLLGFSPEILVSSAMGIPAHLRGQDRIIAIARAAGAAAYVNLPGGRALYDPQTFRQAGIGLCFLPPWRGDLASVLPALMGGGAATLRAEILSQCNPEPA